MAEHEQKASGLIGVSSFATKEPSLANYLDQANTRIEQLEKELYRLRSLATKLVGNSPEAVKDSPESSSIETLVPRVGQLGDDLEKLARDFNHTINRIESALG